MQQTAVAFSKCMLILRCHTQSTGTSLTQIHCDLDHLMGGQQSINTHAHKHLVTDIISRYVHVQVCCVPPMWSVQFTKIHFTAGEQLEKAPTGALNRH